jgi:hypothetical protein
MHGKKVTGGKVKLIVGEPIPTTGLTIRDRAALTTTMRDRIVEMLDCGADDRFSSSAKST